MPLRHFYFEMELNEIFVSVCFIDSCVVCDSENDTNCVQDPSLIMARGCRTQDQVGCYTRVIGKLTINLITMK